MHLFWIHLYLFIRTIVGQSELVGHLKPLGYQHPPTIFLDEFEVRCHIIGFIIADRYALCLLLN